MESLRYNYGRLAAPAKPSGRCLSIPIASGEQSSAERRSDQVASRRTALIGGTLALLPCGCQRPLLADTTAWRYGGTEGPHAWGGLCATGNRQSPIDLPSPARFYQPGGNGIKLSLNYSTSAELSIVKTGHGNIQVNVPPGSYCSIDNRQLQLLQWHFHAPSEHAFDGQRQAMEAHLVHRDTSSGELAVLAILMQRGAAAPLSAVQMALKYAPQRAGEPRRVPGLMDLNAVLGAAFPAGLDRSHCEHYTGSLTTPPCSEGVQWYVWEQPGGVTNAQILDFESSIGARGTLGINARPLQASWDRKIDML